jgi:transcriptional regulator with XRE-family HTH domain
VTRGPRRHTTPVTRLAALRHASGYTQREIAQLTGLSLATVKRLEGGQIANPPLRYLVNCALALHVGLDEVIEPEWTSWTRFSAQAPEPPDEPPPAAREAGRRPPSEA